MTHCAAPNPLSLNHNLLTKDPGIFFFLFATFAFLSRLSVNEMSQEIFFWLFLFLNDYIKPHNSNSLHGSSPLCGNKCIMSYFKKKGQCYFYSIKEIT